MIQRDEIDLIHSYWKDQSQDPEFISQDTGIDLEKVMEILELLSNQGNSSMKSTFFLLPFNVSQ
jgi:biopolymer transport protein ExbD